jgi:minor histocompatibility antigen H13
VLPALLLTNQLPALHCTSVQIVVSFPPIAPFQDIFWVFATPVMVSVAKNFEAPIKLLFPRPWDAPVGGKAQFSMLGLGDIVIPGIFVAIMLRYDVAHRARYFYSAFAGYAAGLVATIVVMNVFKAAQPALLYIVPGVLGATFAHAVVHGEASTLFHWHEKEHHEQQEGAKAQKQEQDATASAADSKKDM